MINRNRNLPNVYRLKALQFLIISLPSWMSAQNRLDDYISHGPVSNHSIKEQYFLLKKNIYASIKLRLFFINLINRILKN